MKNRLAAVLAGALLSVAPLALAAADPPPFTAESAGASSILYRTTLDVDRGSLRIVGPEGFLLERAFQGSDDLAVDLADDGEALQDGSYRWSLTYVSPVDRKTDRSLRAAWIVGDLATVERLQAEGRLVSGTASGSFTVLDGRMIVPRASTDAAGEAPGPDGDLPAKDLPAKDLPTKDLPTKDQVIADDLIVTGATCIGSACVDGEVFDLDDIRLKEDRLRIKFEDTSIGTFPSNDWQIAVNDIVAGGQSRFSIEDVDAETVPFTVVAGAPSHSLYTSSSGRVGFGTSTPVTELHVVDIDTPTLRLEQEESSSFDAYTWDLGGNEHGFFLRDVTGGSTLPVRVRPGADSEVLVVDSDSQVGIGTGGPTARLHVKEERSGTGEQKVVGKFENDGPVSLQLVDTDSGDDWVFSNKPAGFEISKGGTGVIEMRVDGSGNLTIQGQLTTGMNVYPDYVFDEGYELMPLDDLARFIEANGHLPNIQPEHEVGYGAQVNLSELSRGLLEKVEELTLYTLEQHRVDRELRQTIEALEARLAALEER